MKNNIQSSVMALPLKASYHGDSTIIVDANGRWVTNQVDRTCVEEIVLAVNTRLQLMAACEAVVESMKGAPILETDWKIPGSYRAWKLCVDALTAVKGVAK